MRPLPPSDIRLGSVALHEVVGRGGAGTVWSGVHVERGVPVAVKVLDHRKLRTDRAAFDDEVRAVAALDHPGIVTLFDHGTVPDPAPLPDLLPGSPYLVMELARGGDLRQRLQLTWPDLRALLLSLLDALAHAHARGVVHRDIKPGNVLLCRDDDLRPGPKLTDFGIAWALEGEDADAEIVGTPRYMAPEQFLGRWRDFGPWTDLYALGCVAWELTTGRTPFTGRDPKVIARAQVTSPLPRYQPKMSVPAGLEGWLAGLLAKLPGDRWERAADAAWALDRLGDAPGGSALRMESPWSTSATLTLDATLLSDREDSGSGGANSMPTLLLSDDTADHDAALPDLFSTAAPAERAVGPQSAPRVPPHPVTWRREVVRIPPRLLGMGLSLYGLRTIPLVDRDQERDTVWSGLAAVRDRDAARAVVLRGSAGNGKSRVVEWIAERAHELGAATVLKAMHSQLGGPGDGLPRMVARHLRCVGLHGAELDARLRGFVGMYLTDDDHAEAVSALLQPDGARVSFADADERFATYGRLLEGVVRGRRRSRRPLILWLDDVQWGAEAIRFGEWLLEHGQGLPVLILLTAQEEALAERPVEAAMVDRLLARPDVTELPVMPLPRGDREELVRALLGLDGELVARVADRTGGNPLFTVQLVGDWVQRGILVPSSGGFRLRPGAEAILPDDLHAVWSDRVERLVHDLGTSVRPPLEIAAALGQDVDAREWRSACAAAAVDIPVGLVDALLERRLAHPTDTGWSFAHGMLRESLARLARAGDRWERHHRACATMLRQLHPDAAERLGRHLIEAGDPGAAVAPLLAGARARQEAGHHREALWLVEQHDGALSALGAPSTDPRWGEGWLMRARAHSRLGERDLALQEARRAEVAARRYGWAALLPRALEQQGALAAADGDLGRAESLMAAAQEGFEAQGDAREAAFALRERGRIATLAGDLQTAAARTEAARVRFLALGSDRGLALCINLLGDIGRLRRDWPTAAAHFRAALALHQAAGRRHEVALTLHGLAEVQRLSGDLAEAEEGYLSCIAMDDALGRDTSVVRLNLGLCLLARAEWAGARSRLDEVRAEWERRGRHGYLACVYVDLLPALFMTGELERFDHYLDEASALLASSGMVDVDIAWPAELAGDLARAAGDGARALRAWQLALRQWQALGDAAKVTEVTASLAEAGEALE